MIKPELTFGGVDSILGVTFRRLRGGARRDPSHLVLLGVVCESPTSSSTNRYSHYKVTGLHLCCLVVFYMGVLRTGETVRRAEVKVHRLEGDVT